ncbi:superoxide dismutase [Sphingobacterium sp. UT-1RO-CII-1]|uniref:superoxide dismutase n=1 Tax=Sphingobacterium sp. UT-1RO-CII-1 TaxID=2995225 RepID=UPI00227AD027|nr:superoxide dismutase [Sphingobacterium sp. UT-1RO-CII-1]MCY4781249.1 superoxide dismutase [Sphingobacterium sp. UT-1RO-CII-1]
MSKYLLPSLPYAYGALEPNFDTETMTIHHKRHHQAYIDNLNKAISGTDAETKDLEDVLRHISQYSPAVRNNGGGHYNHSLFWNILSPNAAQTKPSGALEEAIIKTFGSIEDLKEQVKQAALAQFGSGWAWLTVKYNGTLAVSSTPNQDNPLMDTNLTTQGYPILGVDVWEHAYYLKYQNKRANYLDAFWDMVDWEAVERNYTQALAKL